jgi:Phosphotransferase enzyme family
LLVRGKPRYLVKTSLLKYCAEAGHDGPPKHFLLTNRGFGNSLASLRANPLLLLQRLGLVAIGKCTALRLPLPARSIRVKNNIRVFFDPVGRESKTLTAKIAIQSAHRTGTLKQEIEARHRLSDQETSRFAVPRVIRHDVVNYAWFEEEFIEARPGIADSDMVDTFLRDAALPIYENFRQSQNVINTLPKLELEADVMESLLLEQNVDHGVLEKRWTASFIHGDLSPANMLRGIDNRLYLIDWELSDIAPVAWDLKKIFHINKRGVLDVLDALRRPDEMTSAEQMQVALACELAFLRKNSESRFSYLMSNRNKSASAAQAMMNSHDKTLVDLIRELGKHDGIKAGGKN